MLDCTIIYIYIHIYIYTHTHTHTHTYIPFLECGGHFKRLVVMAVHKDTPNNTPRDVLQYFSKVSFVFKVSCDFTVDANLFPPIGRTPPSPLYIVTIMTLVDVGAMKAYKGVDIWLHSFSVSAHIHYPAASPSVSIK